MQCETILTKQITENGINFSVLNSPNQSYLPNQQPQ